MTSSHKAPWASLLLLLACTPSGGLSRRPAVPWTDSSPHQIRFVSVAPGVRLEVIDWGGSGPPLVFLTGLQAYQQRVFGMRIPEAQLRAIGRYDSHGRLVANVTPAAIDSLILIGCGHPDYSAVRAPALVIYAMVDSAPDMFPSWSTLGAGDRAAARRFTDVFQSWATAERARVRRELPEAQILELHGANHYVFDSHRVEVTGAMRSFLAGR
jgi:hypothetical protein